MSYGMSLGAAEGFQRLVLTRLGDAPRAPAAGAEDISRLSTHLMNSI